MIDELVALVVFWLNALSPSPSSGVNPGPLQIVTGLTIDYVKHCRLQFGEYAQVHEAQDNTMQEQTIGYIALRPTNNTQGAYFFMSLMTGRGLNRQSFTPLTIPQDVINGVHCPALRNPKGLDILDRGRRPFLEPEYRTNIYGDNYTYAPSDNNSSNNEYNIDANQRNHDNLHMPPDQENDTGACRSDNTKRECRSAPKRKCKSALEPNEEEN